MKLTKKQLRKIIIHEIKISIAQQAPVEEELGSAQTYVTAKPTSYIASHDATMGQISEDEDEDGMDEGITLTKSWLRAMIQETMDDFLSPDEDVVEEKKKTKLNISKAVNPKHKGYCTPMTKKTCTPRRKALAKRFKSGDIHKANLKKGKNPHGPG